MNRLEGRVAFLVGGGAGIAKACALMFAKEGAKVIVADINPATGRASADAVLAQGGEAIFVKMDATIEASVKGTMLACRHVIPQIVAAGGGAVVNMSSGAGLRGANPAHIYTAAKGAIISLTRALAGTYAKNNIRVNCICAGRTNTERVRATYGMPGKPGSAPDRQNVTEQLKTYPFWMGEPEDIAAVALFLASHESRMITGAAIPADGGRSAY